MAARMIARGRGAWLLLCCALTPLGCVERRFVVETDPPTALVLRDGHPIGASPADSQFDYYGKYHLTIIKEGFETLQVDQPVPAPWYEFPGLDFVVENLYPFKIRDVRRFSYRLQPVQPVPSNEVLDHAQELRGRGQGLAPPPGHVPTSHTPPLLPGVPVAPAPSPVLPPAPAPTPIPGPGAPLNP
jgi:hypothetical protein